VLRERAEERNHLIGPKRGEKAMKVREIQRGESAGWADLCEEGKFHQNQPQRRREGGLDRGGKTILNRANKFLQEKRGGLLFARGKSKRTTAFLKGEGKRKKKCLLSEMQRGVGKVSPLTFWGKKKVINNSLRRWRERTASEGYLGKGDLPHSEGGENSRTIYSTSTKGEKERAPTNAEGGKRGKSQEADLSWGKTETRFRLLQILVVGGRGGFRTVRGKGNAIRYGAKRG